MAREDSQATRGRSLCHAERVGYRTSVGSSRVSYRSDFEATLHDLLDRLPDGSTVAELGAGANPVLATHPRVAAGELELVLIDISREELDKAPAVGEKLCLDVAAQKFPLDDAADLACSQMLAEHVRDGEQLLRNVARLLRPGGAYLQLSPTLYTLPFVVNRIAPQKVSEVMLDTFQPRDRVRRGKFPAYYSLCRGPSESQIERIERAGLRLVAARGYFGHSYYRRVPVLRQLEGLKSRMLVRHPLPWLCSFCVFVVERPPDQTRAAVGST